MEYVSVSEKAKEWGLAESTVIKYCREGMILNADQLDGKIWSIPNSAVKPFLTRHQVRCFLDYMQSVQQGAKPNIGMLGLSHDDIKKGYDFISGRGYCTPIQWIIKADDRIDYAKSFKGVQILKYGQDLMEADKKARARQEAKEE